MYFVKTPAIIKIFYRKVIWHVKGAGNIIYLTFDDGPDREITPAILDILQKYNAKATFFCLGEKVVQNPDLTNLIRVMGHSIGNHSYHHIKSSHVTPDQFLDDVEKCEMIVHSKLFRPPYGKISRAQINKLRPKYRIILWSVLAGDFDQKVTWEKCLSRSIKNTKGGSIVVFHDNAKAKEKVLRVLPEYLDTFSKLGYTFEPLKEEMFI
jgi:peptidoglycan/xylan/chitin deacetylase (PgdA/CDA1 family)